MTAHPSVRLRAADAARDVTPPDPVRAAALLDRIVADGVPPVRRRRRRLLGAALGAAVLAGSGGAAYGVLSQAPSTALGLACAAGTTEPEFQQAGQELRSSMDVRSGDPVADCAAEYERLEGAAPELVGWSTGGSALSVVPAGWDVPEHWQRLATGSATTPHGSSCASASATSSTGPSRSAAAPTRSRCSSSATSPTWG